MAVSLSLYGQELELNIPILTLDWVPRDRYKNAKTRSPWRLLGKIAFRQIQYRSINLARLQNQTAAYVPSTVGDGMRPSDSAITLHNASVSASPDYYNDANKH